jgi:hypothetical protein
MISDSHHQFSHTVISDSHHQFSHTVIFLISPHVGIDRASKHEQQKIYCSSVGQRTVSAVGVSSVGQRRVSAVDVSSDVRHIRNQQQASSVSVRRTVLSDSWDTDFNNGDDDDDDDDTSKVSDMIQQFTLKCTIRCPL